MPARFKLAGIIVKTETSKQGKKKMTNKNRFILFVLMISASFLTALILDIALILLET
jgi:hypothetical protein